MFYVNEATHSINRFGYLDENNINQNGLSLDILYYYNQLSFQPENLLA